MLSKVSHRKRTKSMISHCRYKETYTENNKYPKKTKTKNIITGHRSRGGQEGKCGQSERKRTREWDGC